MTEGTTDLRQRLLGKLKGGNTRFVHLNATIGRSRDKLDLLDLDKIKEGYAEEFVSQLLSTPNLAFKVSFKDIESRLLKFINEHDQRDDQSPEQEAENRELLAELKVLRDTKRKLEFLEAFQKKNSTN